MKTDLELATVAGPCRTSIFSPDTSSGPWPAVVFCIDGVGRRAALEQMAARISQAGYVVALPDLFYRAGSVFELMPPGTPHEAKSFFSQFGTPGFRDAWQKRFFGPATSPENIRVDIGAVLDALAKRSDVRSGPVGVTGYCMGGNISLRVAAIFGDRIAAAASFHGGFLASPAPDSPHLGAPKIKAQVYAACAVEDPSCTDEMRQRLIDALATAGVKFQVELYAGARHGFAVPDSPSFNAEAAERHHAALLALLGRAFAAA